MMAVCLLLLLGQVLTTAEIQARRESLKLKTTDEVLACSQQQSSWDRWNDQGPHEELPMEADAREALVQCLSKTRAEALAAPKRNAELQTRREALRPKNDVEMMACVQQWSSWDRWNVQGPHDELPPEAAARVALEECLPKARADAAAAHEASRVANAAVAARWETAHVGASPMMLSPRNSDEWGVRQMSSAYICALRSARVGIEKNIAEEKRYATQTGVVNLGRLEFLKQRLRGIDGTTAQHRQRLAEIRRKVLPCNSPGGQGIVRKLSRCVAARAEVEGEIVQWDQIGSDAECSDTDVVWMLKSFGFEDE